jgi:hypothetical protein
LPPAKRPTDGSRRTIRKALPSNIRCRNSGDGCPRSQAGNCLDGPVAKRERNLTLLRRYGPVRVEIVLRIIPGVAQIFEIQVAVGAAHTAGPDNRRLTQTASPAPADRAAIAIAARYSVLMATVPPSPPENTADLFPSQRTRSIGPSSLNVETESVHCAVGHDGARQRLVIVAKCLGLEARREKEGRHATEPR